MPRLGDGNESHMPRRAEPAEAFARVRKVNIRNVCFVMVILFILRNFLTTDYRKREMEYLKSSGMSEEEIEKYIPATASERKKQMETKQNDFMQMKGDVMYLMREVESLKKLVHRRDDSSGGGADQYGGGRDAILKQMEQVHEEKRRRREQQQREEHPDFKPSVNRVRRRAEEDEE